MRLLPVLPVRRFAAALLLATSATRPSVAQTTTPPPPALSAVWLTAPIALDGRLDEPIWSTAPVASGFVQRQPANGAPASQATEVRVAYDAHALYVAVRNHDTAADSIAQQLGRRDADDIYADWFFVGLDSYGDKRTAFVFGVNPRGVLRDEYLFNDDDGDQSWDAVWNVVARVDSAGWTAEFRIPLSQLRYDVRGERGAVRPWGLNFSRVIARHGEESFWAPTPADAPGFVSRFGTLTGLDSLQPASRLELLPYVRSQLELQPPAQRSRFTPTRDVASAIGGDARIKLPQSLTLTATLNPDFGQAEADPAVVNLSAFEIFFPERRAFFLENADGFAFGGTRTLNDNDPPQFFYSRRIGRAPQRRPTGNVVATSVAPQTPIAAALKLSGTTPSGWQVGVLNAVTVREQADVLRTDGSITREAVEPRTNYHVSRVRRLLDGGNTGVGAFLADTRRALGDSLLDARLASNASVLGFDAEHAWQNRTYAVSAVWAASRVQGSTDVLRRLQLANYRALQRPDADHLGFDPERTSLTGHFAALSIAKLAGERTLGSLTYEETSPGFEVNDLGFQVRSDVRSLSSALTYRNPFLSGWSREWSASVFQTLGWNFGGDRTETRTSLLADVTALNFWSANYRLSVSPRTVDDRLLRGGPLALRPTEVVNALEVTSDERRSLIGSLEVQRTTDAGGRRSHSAEFELDWRPLPQARVRVGPSFETGRIVGQYVQAVPDARATATFGTRYVFADVQQREARFDTRVDWTFSPWLSLQLFLQPFASSGAFTRFKEFRTPRTFTFAEYGRDLGRVTFIGGGLRVDPDADGDAPFFEIPTQDFTVRALRGNAVLRWEYQPGSTIFVVWSQQREAAFEQATTGLPRQVGRAFADPGQHVFLVKFSRWLGR